MRAPAAMANWPIRLTYLLLRLITGGQSEIAEAQARETGTLAIRTSDVPPPDSSLAPGP